MKKIVFPAVAAESPFQTLPILEAVMAHGGQGGVPLTEQRKRFRVLDVIERQLPGPVLIEDADYAAVKAAVDVFPFAMGRREFVAIGDAIDAAEDVQPTVVPMQKVS